MKKLNPVVSYLWFPIAAAIFTFSVISIQPFAREHVGFFFFLWILTPILGWMLSNHRICKYYSPISLLFSRIILIVVNLILFFSWIAAVDKIHEWVGLNIFNDFDLSDYDLLSIEDKLNHFGDPIFSHRSTRIALSIFDILSCLCCVIFPTFIWIKLDEAIKNLKQKMNEENY